jgi:hypothetical protein
MTVRLKEQEFNFIYQAFEQLTSPYSTNEELAEAIALQIDVWEMLKEIATRNAGVDEIHPSPEEPHSSLGRTFRSAYPVPT